MNIERIIILVILYCLISFISIYYYRKVQGWKYIYGIWFPLTWEQDSIFINNGDDIVYIAYKNDKRGYFTGTVKEWNMWYNSLT